MFENAAADVEECGRDHAEKMTVTSAIMKGLVKALEEDIGKALPATDADTGRLKESLEEKDINTIWSCLLKKAEDHVAGLLLKMQEEEEVNADNPQLSKRKYLLDCEAAECEEIWRVEIQSDLVSAYFESLLKSLVDQVNTLIMGLLDSRNELASCQQELSTFVDQSTKGIESIQGKISLQSEQSKCDLRDLKQRVKDLRAELEYRLNKEGEDVECSEEDLESVLWKHNVETSIFLEVVQGVANEAQAFERQEAHLRDLLDQEHRKVSELLTKTEELHKSKDALQASLEAQQFRQKTEWEISRQIIEDKAVDMEGNITDLSNMLLSSSEERFEAQRMRQVMEFEISSRICEDKIAEMAKNISDPRDMLRATGARAAESLGTEIDAAVDSAHKGDGDVPVAEIDMPGGTELVEGEIWRAGVEGEIVELVTTAQVRQLARWVDDSCLPDEKILEQSRSEITVAQERDWVAEVVGSMTTRPGVEEDGDAVLLGDETQEAKLACKKTVGDSGLMTDKTERSAAFEDKLLILRAELEGYKAALKRAEAKKESSKEQLVDQAVGGPASTTDPVLVVIRRDTEAAVEGFMVDIGESPSKNFSSRKSKEVVSSLKREVLELQREREQMMEQHVNEVYKLKRESMKEIEKIKVEAKHKQEDKVAKLKEEVLDLKHLLEQASHGRRGRTRRATTPAARSRGSASAHVDDDDDDDDDDDEPWQRENDLPLSSLGSSLLSVSEETERHRVIGHLVNHKVTDLSEDIIDKKQMETVIAELAMELQGADNAATVGEEKEEADDRETLVCQEEASGGLVQLAKERCCARASAEGDGSRTVSDSWKDVFRELVRERRSFERSLTKLETIVDTHNNREDRGGRLPRRENRRQHLTELEDELLLPASEAIDDESWKLEQQRAESAVLELETMLERLEKVRVEVDKTISQKNLRIGKLMEQLVRASAAADGSSEKEVRDPKVLESRIGELEMAAATECETKRKRLEVSVADLLTEQRKLKERAAAMDEEQTRLQEQVATMDEERTRLQERAAAMDEEHTRLEEQAAAMDEEQTRLQEQAAAMDEERTRLHEVIANLKGERSWLEERVPGLERKIATEQSRLEEMAAVHAFERDRMKEIIATHKNEQSRLEKAVGALMADRNQLGVTAATLAQERNRIELNHKKEREGLTELYERTLTEMEHALGRAQKELKDERAQKGEPEVLRMKAELGVWQQKLDETRKHLLQELEQACKQAAGSSAKLEDELSESLDKQKRRLEEMQEQIGHLHRLIFHGPLSKDDYLVSAWNLKKAEVEVDLLGDEVDNLMALLERVYTVLERYSPVLQHYPGVKEIAETIKTELVERTGDPIVQ